MRPTLPVCLLTVEGQGLNETQLHDYLQYQIRNQIAGVPGATVPPPFGQVSPVNWFMLDPLKLQAHELSPMDVVRATNDSNLILPAGDVRWVLLTTTSTRMLRCLNAAALTKFPSRQKVKSRFLCPMFGKAVDGSYLQYNMSA